MPSIVPDNEAGRLAADLAVLAEPHRLLVLSELRGGPRSAGSLARATKMAPSLASHHLAVLLKAELVSRWREGSFVYYALERDRIGEVHQALLKLTRTAGARSGPMARSHPEAASSQTG